MTSEHRHLIMEKLAEWLLKILSGREDEAVNAFSRLLSGPASIAVSIAMPTPIRPSAPIAIPTRESGRVVYLSKKKAVEDVDP
ncbi:MAG: hypothetical protein JW768_04210 [Chitinispirillaceae bacterium]|nr:hypothetical protein [Chitinispirillaceae bacterium]